MGLATTRLMHIASVTLQLAGIAAASSTSGCSGVPSLLNGDQAERFLQTAFDYIIVGLYSHVHTKLAIPLTSRVGGGTAGVALASR